MRFEGTLKTWNDDRGFGFIEPAQGGSGNLCARQGIRSTSPSATVGAAV